jgi:hypothetical protein
VHFVLISRRGPPDARRVVRASGVRGRRQPPAKAGGGGAVRRPEETAGGAEVPDTGVPGGLVYHAMESGILQCKGTVSRGRFGFCRHVWLVLCLNRGPGRFLNFLGDPMIL